VHEHDGVAVQRRLEELALFLRSLGHQTRETYERVTGVLAAMPDASFPIADARFSRRDDGISYHSRGAVYFGITRDGEHTVSGQKEGAALTSALVPYVQVGCLLDLQGRRPEDIPTEWFPRPRLLLDTVTSDLFIARRGTRAGLRLEHGFRAPGAVHQRTCTALRRSFQGIGLTMDRGMSWQRGQNAWEPRSVGGRQGAGHLTFNLHR
jgi:hypothetical protein